MNIDYQTTENNESRIHFERQFSSVNFSRRELTIISSSLLCIFVLSLLLMILYTSTYHGYGVLEDLVGRSLQTVNVLLAPCPFLLACSLMMMARSVEQLQGQCLVSQQLTGLSEMSSVLIGSDAIRSDAMHLKEVLPKGRRREPAGPARRGLDRNLVYGMALCHQLDIHRKPT